MFCVINVWKLLKYFTTKEFFVSRAKTARMSTGAGYYVFIISEIDNSAFSVEVLKYSDVEIRFSQLHIISLFM